VVSVQGFQFRRSEHFNCCFNGELLELKLAFFSDSNSEKEVYFGVKETARAVTYHENKIHAIHTGKNNWCLKWFYVRMKRCILDGRLEKP